MPPVIQPGNMAWRGSSNTYNNRCFRSIPMRHSSIKGLVLSCVGMLLPWVGHAAE